MEDRDVLKMLFEEHHRQYSNRWHSVKNRTNATVASLVLITGWTLISKNPPSSELKPFIIGFISVLSLISSLTIISSIPNIKSIAIVIEKVNIGLGLYEKGRYIESESLYPDNWKNFGSRHHLAVIGNCILIWCSSGLCIAAVLIRGV